MTISETKAEDAHQYVFEVHIIWDQINRPNKPVLSEPNRQPETRKVMASELSEYVGPCGKIIRLGDAGCYTEPWIYEGGDVTISGFAKIVKIIPVT